jgi:hypothetical protein
MSIKPQGISNLLRILVSDQDNPDLLHLFSIDLSFPNTPDLFSPVAKASRAASSSHGS